MPRAEFLSNLSSEIFGRLRELRQEQETKDSQQKQQTIALLSSLADKVEPESLPTLLGHMGDVIGMKGDLRKFWDAFSGMPDRSLGDKLGTYMNQAMGGMVGPETAKTARQNNLEQLLQPYREQGSRPRQVSSLPGPQELAGKIVFRDPMKEKISEIEARYATQAAAQDERQNLMNQFRAKQQEDRQAHDKEMADLRAQMKAESDIKAEEARLVGQRGLTASNPMIRMEAARNVAKRQAEQEGKLQATTDYLKAKTRESQTMADAMQRSGGLTPGQEVNVQDRRREAARSLKTAYDKSMGRRAEAQKLMESTADTIDAELKKMGGRATFDRATGTIVSKEGKESAGMISNFLRFPKLLDTYAKASAEIKGAETEAKGYWGNLGTAPYNKYYSLGKDFTEPIQEKSDDTSPVVPQGASGTTLPLNNSKGIIRIPKKEGVVLNVGQNVNYMGKPHVVTYIEPDGTAVLTPRKR